MDLLVRLPNTCPENKRSFPHVRLLTQVRADAWNASGFEGKLHAPGVRIELEALGEQPVLLEFAGPQGLANRGKKREHLWILWRYDFAERDWREIARAMAMGWEWALTLRDPAIRAMRPVVAAEADPAERGREVTAGLLDAIDAALVTELPAVRALVLSSIYDRMAGRLAAA